MPTNDNPFAALVLSTVKKAIESAAEADLGTGNVTVVREGTQILLPEGMSIDQAIGWLNRKKTEEERKVAVNEEVTAFPLEGAYALQRALSFKFGWVDLVPTPGFFGDTPPTMIGIETGFGRTTQVPWGRIQIPGVDGYIVTGFKVKDGRFLFAIGGEVKQKHRHVVAEIANLTRRFVQESSLYRGQAIRVTFPPPGTMDFNPGNCPRFLNVEGVNEDELIFSQDLMRRVETELFTPVTHTSQCRRYGIPLKRGVLLEGAYGTGKTLTAYMLAKRCTENGWTFIYLDSPNDLPSAISFAREYQPAVIFAEDIDRVMRGNNRSEFMDSILNTIDGIGNKGSEIMVVLTTNEVEEITQAMLRPGRIDTVISVEPPDAEAVERLIRLYARDLLADGTNLTTVGRKLEGQIPAFIRETVERAKLAAVQHVNGHGLVLREHDLEVAADTMLNHLELLAEPEEDETNDVEKLAHVLGSYIRDAFEADYADEHTRNAYKKMKDNGRIRATESAGQRVSTR